MNKIILLLMILNIGSQTVCQVKKDYPIQPVPFTQVHITDGFWFDRMETNRTVTIPYAIKMNETTGRVTNLEIAAGLKTGEYCTRYPFDDTDIYKVIEGASYSLMLKPDKELEKKLDELIDIIAKAQEPDGYIYSARTGKSDKLKGWIGPERWSNLQSSHELYNAGHMFEAAVAHFMATNKKSFLTIALKCADLLVKDFGPGKVQLPPGHQEVELGLVKLYRLTGEEKYLNLAKYFLDIRGRGKELTGRESWGEYSQDHKPIIEQDEAVGHAVRAGYMYSAIADVAALTGDESYIKALDKIWNNVVSKKLYLTGGLGATGSWEGFGPNYDLPNASAYNETCASIANVYWNHRMFLLKGEGKYIDILERTLYNALLSGISISGDKFFYPNPLESFGTHERSAWFECACCPGNVTRFIASVANYIYAVNSKEIYVNLFTNNKADLKVGNDEVVLSQTTNYPWDGKVVLNVNLKNQSKGFSINLRIPGWAQDEVVASDLYQFIDKPKSKTTIRINGKQIDYNVENGFAKISRTWNDKDVIELILPMEVKRIVANNNVEADRGRIALQRGPLVYCTEGIDNNGYARNILLTGDSKLNTDFQKNLLSGVEIITGKAYGVKSSDKNILTKEEQNFVAIPYYAWAHRGKTEMSVWIANDEKVVRPLYGSDLLSNAQITASAGKNPEVIADRLEPKNSIDHSLPFFHWWPNKGTAESVQIDFQNLEEISQVDVYWFDDTGIGECRIPSSWKVFYKEGDKWREVYTVDKYGVEKDKYNSVTFETVRTKSLKIEIHSQPDFAGGIHEIKIK
ncbi:MAG: glycoside hydrolase family 127 protein [Ignavibacteria bacterium]|nr:glycoside hydrolase family 127 protein [Ignavibacteria bacterium]